MRRTSSILPIVLGLLLVAGCGDDDAATTTTASQSTGSLDLETYLGDGFEILLPPRWTLIEASDLSSGDVGDLIAEGMSGMDLPEGFDSGTFADQIAVLFEQGGKLFALDMEGSSPGFVDNLNIVALPHAGLSIESVRAVTVQQFEDIFGATVTFSEVRQLPGGEAAIVRYRGFQPVIEGISVTILTSTPQWSLTLSATDVARLDAMFSEMLESFREVG